MFVFRTIRSQIKKLNIAVEFVASADERDERPSADEILRAVHIHSYEDRYNSEKDKLKSQWSVNYLLNLHIVQHRMPKS